MPSDFIGAFLRFAQKSDVPFPRPFGATGNDAQNFMRGCLRLDLHNAAGA